MKCQSTCNVWRAIAGASLPALAACARGVDGVTAANNDVRLKSAS
jgi:hypothetical protein